MDTFILAARRLSVLSGIFASLLLGSAIVIVCQMVVMRYFLNMSTVWQTDFVTFALVAATFTGSPYVLLRKGHVNVDLVAHYLPRQVTVPMAVIAGLFGLSFTALLAWTGYELFHEAWVNNWRTETVWGLPLWIPYLSMPIGMGIMIIQYVSDVLAVATGREEPFAGGGGRGLDAHDVELVE